jgi:molybdopterin-biosynthesis enzyme MoeA-like protein
MPAVDSSASKEVVTAALLVIGGKILSGRTKDQNIGYVAEYLTAVGIDLKEVRVVGDEESAIVDALNALRHRYTYVFTTGGIGPTHGDITADCVAKAFLVPIESDPRALAILHAWVKTTGAEMNEARLRLTRIPKGADLILNKVSGAPGFWIGNVIVMAGVPSINNPRFSVLPNGRVDRRNDHSRNFAATVNLVEANRCRRGDHIARSLGFSAGVGHGQHQCGCDQTFCERLHLMAPLQN